MKIIEELYEEIRSMSNHELIEEVGVFAALTAVAVLAAMAAWLFA